MARRDLPVIIEAAVNGATRKERNANVPVSVDELVDTALACIAAGAAIVHQHDDLTGRRAKGLDVSPAGMADASASVYRRVLAERPDALLYPTANFGGPVEFRWGHHALLAAEGLIRVAFVDPGSVNLWRAASDGTFPPTHLVYENSHSDIAYKMDACRSLGLGPNMAIFEPGFLRAVLALERAGALAPGAFVKLYFGGPRGHFGLPPTQPSFDAYLAMLEGSNFCWAVAVLGGDVFESGAARWALEQGGHLRVGLEDHAGPGKPSNVELVERAVALCAEVGRPVATPTEAAELLGLPAR